MSDGRIETFAANGVSHLPTVARRNCGSRHSICEHFAMILPRWLPMTVVIIIILVDPAASHEHYQRIGRDLIPSSPLDILQSTTAANPAKCAQKCTDVGDSISKFNPQIEICTSIVWVSDSGVCHLIGQSLGNVAGGLTISPGAEWWTNVDLTSE